MTVVEALACVMEDVQSVKKGGFNQAQNYSFRGVDQVVNAVGPALRKHGVVVTPRLLDERIETYQTNKGSTMYRAVLHVTYDFHGPEGDVMSAEVAAEASDSADKAIPKAMSVALRTALIQTLCLPTDDPDPDAFSPPLVEPARATSSPKGKLIQAKAALWKYAQGLGWDRGHLTDDYQRRTGNVIGDAAAEDLTDYLQALTAEHEPAGE